jgi:hypothetical protein
MVSLIGLPAGEVDANGLILYINLGRKHELNPSWVEKGLDYGTPAEHATIFTVCIPICLDMETKSTPIPFQVQNLVSYCGNFSYTQNEWCGETLLLILLHYMALYPAWRTTDDHSPFAIF